MIPLNSDSEIQKLPDHLINQIKAGEVIERPANIVKELMENSLDAKASQVELTIIGHGLDLISVVDDGKGMNRKDLELAFLRHTTSKLFQFDDIYKLQSYGFRGEALGSIASVSQIACSSFRNENLQGQQVLIEGGEIKSSHSIEKTDLNHGTKMVVKDLFYNTPVRYKFIQSAQTEKNWIKRIFYSFVLGHPECQFSFKWENDEKNIYSRLEKQDYLGRIKQLLDKKDLLEIKTIDKTFHQMRVRLFLVPKELKIDYRFSYILINQRLVIDKGLSKLIHDLIANLSPQEDFHDLLLIDLPSDFLDVNIHPHKTSVKIFESQTLWSFVASCVKEIFNVQKSQTIEKNHFSNEILPPIYESTELDSPISYESHFKNESQINPISILYQFEEALLIMQKNEGPYFLSKKNLLLTLKDMIFNLKEPHTPLFISYPLNKNLLTLEIIHRLRANGWEIDDLGDTKYVLRTLPTSISHLSIHTLLLVLSSTKIILENTDWLKLIDLNNWQNLKDNKIIIPCIPPV